MKGLKIWCGPCSGMGLIHVQTMLEDDCPKCEGKGYTIQDDPWTSVSEGFPEEGPTVLVTVSHFGLIRVDDASYKNGRFHVYGYGRNQNLIAWKPLPAPYNPKDSK